MGAVHRAGCAFTARKSQCRVKITDRNILVFLQASPHHLQHGLCRMHRLGMPFDGNRIAAIGNIHVQHVFKVMEVGVMFTEQQRNKAVVIKGHGDPSVIVFGNGYASFSQ